MRKILLLEEFGQGDSPMLREKEIREILTGLDVKKYFSIDVEKCGVELDIEEGMRAESEVDNEMTASFYIRIVPIAYKINPKLFEEIDQRMRDYIKKNIQQDSDLSLIYDLGGLGFDQKEFATAGKIKEAIETLVAEGPESWLNLLNPEAFIIKTELEPGGDDYYGRYYFKKNYMVRTKITKYTGGIDFNSDQFVDELLVVLFE